MSSVVVVVTDDAQERTPLLQNPSPLVANGDSIVREEEIVPSSPSSNEPDGSRPNSISPDQRLVSLDVFRGLTVALMILVDDAGGAFPSINHSPWFGVTLADFVMPFFLFVVGVAISLVFKKISSKPAATKKVMLRTVKLFIFGLLLQGGYFHGRNHLTYGVDIGNIRWLGVLQRISIGYLFASVLEIWLVNNIVVDSTLTFMKKYYLQWMVAIILGSVYMGLLYGLYVPNWEFEVPSVNVTSSMSGYDSGTQILYQVKKHGVHYIMMKSQGLIYVRAKDSHGFPDILKALHEVQCGVRGSLEPPCNAVGLIDRYFLGEHHLYQHPVYRRTKECSVNSPDYGPLPPTSPQWCLAPFDPEGILSSLMAAITCFVGLLYGHIALHFKGNMQRVFLWSLSSFPLLILGYVLNVLGVPFSKPLYTLSYMCITAGTSGFLLTIIFYIVDVKHIEKPTKLLQWMGKNALIIYILAACDLFPAALQGFYWHSPENNLVDNTESLLQFMLHSKKWGTLAFVLLEILFWGVVAGVLDMKRVYFRL